MTIIKDAMGEPITFALKTGELVTVPVRGEAKIADSAITDEILKARDNGLVFITKEEKPITKAKTNKNGGVENE